jgi:hypothetical protein
LEKNLFFDIRKLPVRTFSDGAVVADDSSFIHRKYSAGRPNNSLDSTPEGTQKALRRILSGEEALFGVHIREAIHLFRMLFNKHN